MHLRKHAMDSFACERPHEQAPPRAAQHQICNEHVACFHADHTRVYALLHVAQSYCVTV